MEVLTQAVKVDTDVRHFAVAAVDHVRRRRAEAGTQADLVAANAFAETCRSEQVAQPSFRLVDGLLVRLLPRPA